MRRAASGFWIIIAATGCGRDRPKQPPAEMPTEQDAGGVDSAEPVPYPASVPAGWVGENLPPRDVLVRRGACPFECCQYGEWWSDSATVVFAAARDTTAIAFTVPPRARFVADGGTVFVTSLARVVFDAPMDSAHVGIPGVALTPSDTLYLVEPVGEGAFIVWLRGRELELPGVWESYYPGTTARLQGEFAREWWAHVRTGDGREGWVWMDRTAAPMMGADACAGPLEP